MDFQAFLTSLATLWPLNSRNGEFPLIMQCQDNPVVIPASGSKLSTIVLPGDCDIQIDDWVATCPGEEDVDSLPFHVGISYGSGDWALNYPSTNLVRGNLLFGNGRHPGRIGYRPWAIATYGNRGILSFNFTNDLTTNTSLTVEIALRGHRNGGR